MSSHPEPHLQRPTRAEVDLGAYDRNIDAILARLPEASRLVAVLKADGYGHGALALAQRCDAKRVAMIATALLEESLELRHGGITLPLLVLGPLNAAQIALALTENITPGVVGPEELAAACAVARERDVTIHLKLDTGMGRMGVTERELGGVIEQIRSTPRLRLGAIYTHFATADDPQHPLTKQQLAKFDEMLATLRDAGIDAPLHHTSNSAATMRGLERAGDYVRVGLALLGAESLEEGGSRLEPLLRWRTEIARLKTLPPGHSIGYGASFHTQRESRIATLPVGYADGYSRLLSNNADVLVRGLRAPVVGRVSMDMITVDVTDIADAAIGDEVVLLGHQGSEEISAEEHARRTGTISYEVFCRISRRVPRVYR